MRQAAAQTQGRTIDRQADSLRRALLRVANGEEGAEEEAAKAVAALRDQLQIVERLATRLAGRR